MKRGSYESEHHGNETEILDSHLELPRSEPRACSVSVKEGNQQVLGKKAFVLAPH